MRKMGVNRLFSLFLYLDTKLFEFMGRLVRLWHAWTGRSNFDLAKLELCVAGLVLLGGMGLVGIVGLLTERFTASILAFPSLWLFARVIVRESLVLARFQALQKESQKALLGALTNTLETHRRDRILMFWMGVLSIVASVSTAVYLRQHLAWHIGFALIGGYFLEVSAYFHIVHHFVQRVQGSQADS